MRAVPAWRGAACLLHCRIEYTPGFVRGAKPLPTE